MRQRSNKVLSVSVTGMAVAIYSGGHPVMLRIEDVEFVVICSTKEKMEQVLAFAGITDAKIQQITDSNEFFDSVRGIRIMLDPYIYNGNTRFTELHP